MRRAAWLAVLLAMTSHARAQEPTRPASEPPRGLLLAGPGISAEQVDAVERALAQRGVPVEKASPAAPPEPAAEATLSDVRPLYRDLRFKEAQARLDAAEDALIADRLPSPALERALAEVELWRGALALLEHDAASAQERFQLAQRLSPTARPDRIFPPEVQAGFREARAPAPKMTLQLRIAPPDARVWLDGRLVDASAPSATPGLHHLVVERADKRPLARVVRLVRAAPEIAANLGEAAPPAQALVQATEHLETAPLGREEAIGVSAALGRPLWVLSSADGKLALERYDAADTARASASMSGADAAQLAREACVVEGRCAPEAAIAPEVPPAPKKPVWKRGWFWAVIGVAAAAVAGAATGAAVGATAPRDYVVRVR